MVDVAGPSSPRACNSVGLQNLGDVEGWEERGDGLYLFNLKDGAYHREALSAVRARIDWKMDFRLMNPYVYTGANHRLSKWQNSGSFLASLLPKENAKLLMFRNFGLAVSSQGRKAGLKYHSEFPAERVTVVPANSTLVFQLGLGAKPAQGLELVKGVSIDWDETAEAESVTIVLQVPDAEADRGDTPVEVSQHISRQDVRLEVGKEISLANVRLYPALMLHRLLYIDELPALSLVEASIRGFSN